MNWKEIANSKVGQDLLQYCLSMQSSIADIRNQPELDNASRLAVVKLLDEWIINKLQVNKGKENEKELGTDEFV